MKKLTILMSVLMVAFTSVFAQGEAASVTLDPHKAYAFAEKSFYDGASSVSFNAEMSATVALVNVDKKNLKLKEPKLPFEAELNGDSTGLDVWYNIDLAKDSLYKDTIVVYENGKPTVADSIFVSVKVTKKSLLVINVANASVFALGDVKLDVAEAGVAKQSKLSIAEPRTITFEKSGTNKDDFDVAIAVEGGDTILKVTFAAEETGSYSATVTLKADNAEDKVVNLSANVTMPDPVLNVAPAEWKETVQIKSGKADAKKNFSIFGTYLQGTVKTDTKEKTSFTWDKNEYAVVFSATKADSTYKDTLVVSSRNAKTVKVPLEITVVRPVITTDDVDFGHVSLADAIKGTEKETTVSINADADWTFKVGGTNASVFAAEKKNGKLSVKLQTNAIGIYSATVTIQSEDALDKVINLNAVVDVPEAVLEVIPSEWKETIKLENNQAKAERQISVNAVYTFSLPTVKLWKGNVGFAWDGTNSKVTFAATKEGTYQDTLIVSVLGATGEIVKKVALEIKVEKGETPTPEVHVTGVTLNKTAAELAIGGTLQLTATVAPADATNKNVAWKSSDATIATVTAAGLVTGVKAGPATITVTTEDGNKTATCAITVKEGEVPPTPTGDADVITYANSGMKGETKAYGDFTISGMPSGATYILNAYDGAGLSYLQLRSKDNNSGLVSTVSGGTVQSVEIKFNEKTTDRKVNVYGSNTAFTSPTELYADGPVLVGTISAADADKKLTITGSYQYVGLRSADGAIYMDEITITWGGSVPPVDPVAVTGVTLDKTTATIEVGTTVTLTATVAPENATNKKVTWASSDATVATVSAAGLVTGVKAGTATITVTTEDGGKTATCAITVKEGEVPPTPGGEADVITYANSGMKGATKAYSDFTLTGADFPSGATYILNAYDGAGLSYLQLRSKDNTSGLVSTVSNGTVQSVEIKFNEKTTDRKVNVYGSNTAFTSPANLYADGPVLVGTISAADADKKLTITGSYQYVGIRSAEGTVYMDQITITYGEIEQKATTTLTLDPKTAKVAVGSTVTIKVQRDGNDQLVWKSMDEKIATVANGVVTGVAEGVVKIAATANNISDTCVVTVVKASDIPTKTIAEFIAAKGGKCYLTGVVSNIKKYDDGTYNKYGNFDLTDASGKIYVYGLLSASGEKQQFQTLGVDEGDTLTVIAETYQQYKETDEIVDAIFVSVKKAGGVGPTPHGDPLDIDYAEAAYIVDEEGPYWMLYAGKYPADETQMFLDYPQLLLFINNPDGKHIAGTFDIFEGTLYTSDTDSIDFVSGTVTVTCLEAGNELYAPYYNFVAIVYDAQGKKYAYEFQTEVIAYDYDTDEDIVLEDQPTQGIENTTVYEFDPNAPIYNIQGMQVDRNTPGILIQNGHKFIINGL